MADIVNLNKARKAKAKAQKAQTASQNRVRFGVSTKLKALTKENERMAAQKLEDKRLDTDRSDKKS